MTTITFTHSVKQLRIVQDLVKRYDGRFVYNPLIMPHDVARLSISFEDSHNYRAFCTMREIIQQKFY